MRRLNKLNYFDIKVINHNSFVNIVKVIVNKKHFSISGADICFFVFFYHSSVINNGRILRNGVVLEFVINIRRNLPLCICRTIRVKLSVV